MKKQLIHTFAKSVCREGFFQGIIIVGAFAAPLYAFAAPPGSFKDAVNYVVDSLLAPIPAILVTLIVLVFFWGLANFIRNTGSEEGRANGKRLMLWGVIALFVVVAMWGLVGVLVGAFNGDQVSYTPGER
jgi:Na+-driven multidrug efflux pump